MTNLIDTVQLQETAASFIELFEITLTDASETTVFLTNGLDGGTENIYFPSSGTGATLNEYVAIPIELKGIEFNAGGAAPRPTLTVANLVVLSRSLTRTTSAETSSSDSDEETLQSILEDNGILSNDDLLGAKVVYRTTLSTKIKAASDLSGYSATAPQEFPSQTFVIERIAGENALAVSFELTSPFDLQNVKIPGRTIIAQYCPWEYQGIRNGRPGGCSWALNSNGRYFDVNDNIITKTTSSDGIPDDSNASTQLTEHSTSTNYSVGDLVFTKHTTVNTNDTIQIWKAKVAHSNKAPITAGGAAINSRFWTRHDVCGKTLNSCKIRFQGNNSDTTLNEGFSLPFGAFPGVLKFR